jgi:hypothetical protein
MYSIEVTQLSKRFPGGSRPVIDDLSFGLPPGACRPAAARPRYCVC